MRKPHALGPVNHQAYSEAVLGLILVRTHCKGTFPLTCHVLSQHMVNSLSFRSTLESVNTGASVNCDESYIQLRYVYTLRKLERVAQVVQSTQQTYSSILMANTKKGGPDESSDLEYNRHQRIHTTSCADLKLLILDRIFFPSQSSSLDHF